MCKNKANYALKAIQLVSLLFVFASASSVGQDIIVDNLDATTQSGNWYDSAGKNPYGENSKYSYSGTFTWYPALPTPGNYDVYAWWAYASSRSSNVVYKVELGGWPYEVAVNQREYVFGGQWNRLGTFAYDGISTAQVSMSINSSTVNANADAVRFVFKGDDETWPVATCPCDGYYNRAIQKYVALGGEMLPQNLETCAENKDWTVAEYITDLADGTRVRTHLWLDVGEWVGVPDIDVVCFANTGVIQGGPEMSGYHRRHDMAGFESELPCRASVLDLCKSDLP